MEYMDEEIIRLRNKNREINNLEYGVYIKGEYIEFEPVKLFEDSMEVTLPKSFIDMPLEIKKIKYPSEQRPQIIKTDLSFTTNFTFSLFNQKVSKDDLVEILDTFKTIVKNINPAIIFYQEDCIDIGDIKLFWFDFKGYAVDSPIYYIYYVTTIGGNLLHGIFNCLISDVDTYKHIAFMVIKSIKDLSREI